MNERRQTVSVPWRAPLRSSLGTGAPPPRELTLITLTDDQGLSGYGESAPLPGYSDDPDAASGLDLAEWDLRGRREGLPVWQLLGGERPPEVILNATIGAEDPERAAVEASAAVDRGFGTIKLKVGVGDDHARVGAVREAIGPDIAIRLDANGAWAAAQAIALLSELAAYGIECCEEPVHGLSEIARVAAALPEVPIALDETARDPDALEQRACTAVCLKVVRCGGITGLLRDAARARDRGYQVYLASTLDGPLGIAAALHAAAVIRPDRASGIATLDRFERPAPFTPVGGVMSPPPGPGLGTGLEDWYLTTNLETSEAG